MFNFLLSIQDSSREGTSMVEVGSDAEMSVRLLQIIDREKRNGVNVSNLLYQGP